MPNLTIPTNPAPGGPGIVPHWTRGAKDAVGTAYSVSSRVWYTMASGVVTEVYYPTIDTPQIRDLQFLVTDGETFFHDERRHMVTHMDCFGAYGLGFKVTNTDPDGRYSIEKVIIGDPHLSCLLVHTKFNVAPEWQGRLQLFVLCAPHLQIGGYHNNGRVLKARGRKFLMAYRDDAFMALASTSHLCKASCGYVGVNDGWTDLAHNFEMNWEYDAALDGNIALTGEIDLSRGPEFTLGIGFGYTAHNAAATLFQSLSIPFDAALKSFLDQWQRTSKRLALMDKLDQRESSLFARSVNLLVGPRRQGLSRRHDRQLEHPLGRRPGGRRSGRLSPGMDARHGKCRDRLARRRRHGNSTSRSHLSRHRPARGRRLLSEFLDRWPPFLDRGATRRGFVSHHSGVETLEGQCPR